LDKRRCFRHCMQPGSWVRSPEIKAEHSPPSSAKKTNVWGHTPLHPASSCSDTQLNARELLFQAYFYLRNDDGQRGANRISEDREIVFYSSIPVHCQPLLVASQRGRIKSLLRCRNADGLRFATHIVCPAVGKWSQQEKQGPSPVTPKNICFNYTTAYVQSEYLINNNKKKQNASKLINKSYNVIFPE